MTQGPVRLRARLADVADAAKTSKPIASRILNGDPTLTPPEMVDPVVFCTVNVRSTLLPAGTLPNVTVLVGDTL